MKKYDAIIIGFGKGGKTLGAYLGNQGKKVALIERDKSMYGGTCINIGCIPTKILVEESEKINKNYSEAIERKNNLITKLRGANYNKLKSVKNMDIYTGTASFESQHIINVSNGEEKILLYGDLIFINTGAKTIIPRIKGIEKTRNIYTSTTIMNVKTLPKKLAVIGGGYIGLEFASIYNNFGSEVTIFEKNNNILLKEEPEIAKEIREDFQNRNINVFKECSILKLENYGDNQVEISYIQNGEEKTLVADGVLVAVGRQAYLDDLNLSITGVKYTERGVIVNEKLQTNIPHIYALGDATGGLQFTYLSLDDFRIIKDNLFGDGVLTTNSRDMIPHSVFISPTLSRVGMTEKEALDAGYEVKVNLLKATMIPRAKILQEERGVLKAIVDKKTGEILGCSLYSVESSEVINIVSMAIKEKKSYSYLRDFIFTHPTMAEALNDLFNL